MFWRKIWFTKTWRANWTKIYYFSPIKNC